MATTPLYAARAAALRAIGMIPDYDLRYSLNESQKRHIRRLWSTYSEIATAPEQFFIRDVSRQTARLTRDNAIATHHPKGKAKAKIYVPRDNYRFIKVTSDKITLRVKEKYVDKQRQILLTPRRKILERIEYLSQEYPLRPNEYIQVRVGGKAPFSERFIDYTSLNNYMQKWEPRDPKQKHKKEELLAQISLTFFTDNKNTRPIDEEYLHELQESRKLKRERREKSKYQKRQGRR